MPGKPPLAMNSTGVCPANSLFVFGKVTQASANFSA